MAQKPVFSGTKGVNKQPPRPFQAPGPTTVGNTTTYPGGMDPRNFPHQPSYPSKWRVPQTGLPFPEQIDPNKPWAPPPAVDAAKNPKYFLPPEQLYPLQTGPITDYKSFLEQQAQQIGQLIPSSTNVRNYNLQNLMKSYNLPMEQLFAQQAMGPVVQNRAQTMDQLRAAMAERGMSNSGVANEGRLSIEEQYLKGVGAAQMNARATEDARRNNMLQQLLQIPADDIRFYEAIRSGTIPASNLYDYHAADWGQAAYGFGTAIRSAASAAAGGGGTGTLTTGGGTEASGAWGVGGGGNTYGGYGPMTGANATSSWGGGMFNQ